MTPEPGAEWRHVTVEGVRLRFANGRFTSLPLHIDASEDLRDVNRFWLNGHDFVRLRSQPRGAMRLSSGLG